MTEGNKGEIKKISAVLLRFFLCLIQPIEVLLT